MTHHASKPCPFKHNGKSANVSDSCCSFRFGYNAVCILAFAISPPFYGRLHEDMSPEEAVEFGLKLRDAIKQLRDDTVEASRGDTAAHTDPDDLRRGIHPDEWEFPVEPVLKEIEAVADWCEKIGRMRFGVRSGY